MGVGQLWRNGEQGEPGQERAEQGDRGLPRQEHKVQPRHDQGGCFIQNCLNAKNSTGATLP